MFKQKLMLVLSSVFLFYACEKEKKVESETDTNYEFAICEETEKMQTYLQCSAVQQLTNDIEVVLEQFALEDMENK